MKTIALTIALLTVVPSVALAQEVEPPPPASMNPPSKRTGLIVAGAVFTGLGVLNLATSPICLTLRSGVKGFASAPRSRSAASSRSSAFRCSRWA